MRFVPCALPSILYQREIKGWGLPEDKSSSARISTSSGTTGLFRLSLAIGCTSRPFSCASLRLFSIWAHNCHSRVISARLDLATLLSILLISLAFSPCPDANGGIGLLLIGSSERSSLHLPRVN